MTFSILLTYLSDIDFSPVQIGWGYHRSRTRSPPPLCEYTASQRWALPFQALAQRSDPFQEWGKWLSHQHGAFSCRKHTCMNAAWTDFTINIEDSKGLTIKFWEPRKTVWFMMPYSHQNILFSFSSSVSPIFTCSWGASFHFLQRKRTSENPVNSPGKPAIGNSALLPDCKSSPGTHSFLIYVSNLSF